MIEEINEQIAVLASFDKGKIHPVLFLWRNRRYTDLEMVSSWSDAEGDAKRLHFSIIAGANRANLYQLCFSTRYLGWRLVRINHE